MTTEAVTEAVTVTEATEAVTTEAVTTEAVTTEAVTTEAVTTEAVEAVTVEAVTDGNGPIFFGDCLAPKSIAVTRIPVRGPAAVTCMGLRWVTKKSA